MDSNLPALSVVFFFLMLDLLWSTIQVTKELQYYPDSLSYL